MYLKAKKLLAVLCIMALAITALPAVPANAAAKLEFKKTYANLYENGTSKGKYTYTLKGVKKGQTVKWSVSGAGKSYVKLKKASTKVTGSTVSNVLTVKTGGKLIAKNKQVILTAKVYSSTGKYESNRVAKGKIKVKPTKVELNVPKGSDGILYVGKSYRFGYKLKPANATSTNVWTVTGKDGVDYSSFMSSTGIFTPLKAGNYTIKASAKIGSSVIKSASATVTVADYMVAAKQATATKIELTYSGNMSEKLKVSDFEVKNAAGASVVVKDLAFSEDGKIVTLTVQPSFKDGTDYTVSDGETALGFEASVGVPVELKILTQKATVGKETVIEYALYDRKGINVIEVYNEQPEFQAEVMNGYVKDGNKLYMTEVGKAATVIATYTNKANSNIKLTGKTVIVCVPAELSGETNFTLTPTVTTPDFASSKYKDNTKVAIGTKYYAHFRALDADKSEIKYSALKYESSDPETMIITSDGKVTPIKVGNVKVTVTATYAGEEYVYSYDVSIVEASYLKTLKLSTYEVSMSNVYDPDYCQYIDVSGLDQYGESYTLENETAVFTDNNSSTYKPNIVTYNAASNRIEVKAYSANPGTYCYTLTLTSGDHKASETFYVNVVALPATGTETYELQLDTNTADLSLSADISSSQYVNVRLAKYRGGVFSNYENLSSATATITKDGYYYGTDLTAGGTTTKQTISGSYKLSLTTLAINDGVCRKAATGTYIISVQHYSSENKGYVTRTIPLTLTDTQDEPTVRIERTKANKSCSNALELAQNCLVPENGMITECVVTGETQPGSQVSLKTGDQINIRSVTVIGTYKIANGKDVSVTYTVNVQKTLTNG